MRVRYLYFGAFLMVVLLLVAACGGGGGGGIGGNDVRDNSMSGGVFSNTGAQQEKQTVEETPEAEKGRLAKEAEDRRLVAVEAEDRRVVAVEAEDRRVVEVEAEDRRLAKEEADKRRLAKEAEGRLAKEAEDRRLAAVEAEKSRRAAVEAEDRRLAEVEAEKSRRAAVEAEKRRVAAVEAEKRRVAAVEAENRRRAAVEAKKRKVAKEAEDRLAKEAEKRRVAAVEAEKRRVAAVEAENRRRAKEAEDRLAKEAEDRRLVAVEAEKSRLAAVEAEDRRLAAVEAEKRRVAAVEAEDRRVAAVEAEKRRVAAVEAEDRRLAAVEAEKRRVAAVEAEKRRVAAVEAENRRLAKEAEDKLAKEAEDRRLAAAEAEKRRLAAAEAEKRKLADRRRLAIEEALAAAEGQAPCAPELELADDSTCSFSQAQYATQVAKVAQQFQSKEYENQWGLATIRADIGYANVRLLKGKDAKPGAGARIGVIHMGIAVDHPAFKGQGIEVQGVNLMGGTGVNAPESLDSDEPSYGTAVSSVIIARPGPWLTENGYWHLGRFHPESISGGFPGVAWGASLKMFAVGKFTSKTVSLELRSYDDSEDGREYRDILSQVDFLNIGVGYGGIIDAYNKKKLRRFFGKRIEAWAQADRAEKTILVWSAGNSSGDSVDVESGMPVYFRELRGHTVAVAAVDESGKIASSSNRCGTAADWCIAAPGQEVSVAYYEVVHDGFGPKLPTFGKGVASGTAFAAAMVTGSLAVMKGLFGDQLSNTDLVARLFATSNKTGRYADKKVYGQGLLDLGAATSPVGEPVIVVVGSIVSGGVPLAMSSLASGKAFGDSLRRSVAGEGVVTFDALGAPFSYDLGSFVGYAKSSSLQERLQTLMDSEDVLEEDPAYGLSAPVMTAGRRFFPSGRVSRTGNGREASGDVSSGVSFGRVADKGHLSVAKGALMVSWEDGEGGLSATAFGTTQPSSTATMRGYTTTPTGYPAGHADKPHTSGGVVAWQPSGAPIGLRAGWMTEQGSVLGASGRGAFGSLTGQTGFVGLHTGWKTDTWSVHASAEFGTIASTPEKSLIKDISGVITSTFGLSATRSFGAGRALQVSLSQPLRVESGRASFVVPVARTKSGSVVRRSFTSGLSPSGRQIDFSLSWHHRVSESSRVHLSGILTHNPGHRASAKPEAALLLGWKHSF